MEFVILQGLQPVCVTELDLFDHFGIRVRPCASDAQYALLTNVDSSSPVVLPNNRTLPFSVTQIIHRGDLIQCNGCCIAFAPRPDVVLPWRDAALVQ